MGLIRPQLYVVTTIPTTAAGSSPVLGGMLLVTLILLLVIVLGSNQTCEPVFRLLRWAANRPEPVGRAVDPLAMSPPTCVGASRQAAA